MKKIYILLLVIALIFIVGCAKQSDNTVGDVTTEITDTEGQTELELDSTISETTNSGELATTEEKVWADETCAPVEIGNRLCDMMGFPDQSVPPKYEWGNPEGIDDMETEYDNISITLDADVFKYNSKIRIIIKNNNNKPFVYYPIPYVEKLNTDNNSWERLIYAPDAAYYGLGWHMGTNDPVVYFNPYFLSTPIEPGQYRFIIFAGEKEFYSPAFEIVK